MICGKRIRLRAVEEDDLSLLVKWFNDPEIAHLVGGWDFPVSLAQQKEWYKGSLKDRTNQRWIVQDTETLESLGLTGLWDIDWHNRQALSAVKIGASDARGKGLGTDVIKTVMSYAFFQVGLNRLWTDILEYNLPSYKAYVEKCGWKVEGVLRQTVFRDGKYYNQLRISILRDEFMKLAGVESYFPKQEDCKIEILPVNWAKTEK